MRTLDENDAEVIEPDLELGHLEPDKLFVQHHDEIPEKLPVKEIDYDNPLWVGSNGGKIVQTTVVSEYQPRVPAWDEYEDILRYILYTEEELDEIEEQKKAEEEARKEAEEQAKKEAQEQEVAEQLQAQMQVAASFAVMSLNLDDEQALKVSMLYADWTVGESYVIGDIRRYEGALYRALQASTGADIYPPDVFVSGWKRIGDPDEEGVFPWAQPLGATDAYNKGDKVTHDGKTWVSDIDGNVWAPGVYGWSEAA